MFLLSNRILYENNSIFIISLCQAVVVVQISKKDEGLKEAYVPFSKQVMGDGDILSVRKVLQSGGFCYCQIPAKRYSITVNWMLWRFCYHGR